MTLEELFQDKSIKVKAKAKEICDWLSSGSLPMDELLAFAENQSPVNNATCIEAIECATKKSTELADASLLNYVTKALKSDEPRVKWESAKVIGNIARKFPDLLNEAAENLLTNANHEGTVVRWATALALGEILKLNTKINEDLLPKVEKLLSEEADNGVMKKYLDALKWVQK